MIRILGLFLVTVFAGLMAPNPAAAQSFADFPETRIDYFLVTGTTPSEIQASIESNGPGMVHLGRPAHARAHYMFTWSVEPRGTDCDFDVRLETWVDFPMLVDEAALSADADARWQSYIQSLEMHEAGHLQLAYETYPSVLQALNTGPCETASERAQAVLEDLARRQRLYDKITDHGARTSFGLAD